MVVVRSASHPLSSALAFLTRFPGSLGEAGQAEWLTALLSLSAAAPMQSDDAVRAAVRDLLRAGGFKPTGRSKPASEYLLRAATEGTLGPINVAVDACNVVSLHSGLPVSVIDLGRAKPPFRIALAEEGTSYVFNASGQTIDVAGLLCLFDQEGACANPVKDAQRTKTHPGTAQTLSIVWGTRSLPGRTEQAVAWYRELISRIGGETLPITIEPEGA